MTLRSLSSASVQGKRVLLRTDFNVPIQQGKVQDVTRLEESFPTLHYLISKGAKTIILTHLGRPKGAVDPDFSLDPVAAVLSKRLGKPIPKLSDCVGPEVNAFIRQMQDGDVVLLENLRFHAEEEKNDPAFARQLASLGELFVNDAFATLHRAHASTEGITHHLPSYAGFLVQKEVSILSSLMENPEHPVALLVGGAKVDTKIGLLEKFLPIADVFVMGGALANTFLKAQGKEVGASLFEEDKLEVAKRFLNMAGEKEVLLPIDYAVSSSSETEPNERKEIDTNAMDVSLKILDLGPQTIQVFRNALQKAKTIVWNGPMGLYEVPAFAEGTHAIAETVSRNTGITVLGGGDTVDALHHFRIDDRCFTHVSTGGGAMLEFLEGKNLPGLSPLLIEVGLQ